MKLIFYVSASKQTLAGEALVSGIELISASEALEKYHERLLLTQSELLAYTFPRPWDPPDRKRLVINFRDAKRYPQGTRYPKTHLFGRGIH